MSNSLCQLAGEYSGTVATHGTLAETKVDGWRCLYFPDHLGQATLWSRNGIPLQGVGHILRALQRIEAAAGEPLFIDGELQIGGTLAATKAHCEREWRQGDAGLFHAFDCVPLAQWRADDCPTPLYERKATLSRIITATAPDPDAWEWEAGSRGRDHGKSPVLLMPERWCSDADDVAAFAHEIWAAGGEGIVTKDAESLYRRRRTSAWQKIKWPSQLRHAA